MTIYQYDILGVPRVIDGDSLKVRLILEKTESTIGVVTEEGLLPLSRPQYTIVDRGFDIYRAQNSVTNILYVKKTLRLHGFDAPESRGKSREAGRAVKDVVSHWVMKQESLEVLSYTKQKAAFKGRFIGSLRGENKKDGSKTFLSLYLDSLGLVKEVMNGKRPDWTEIELDRVIQTVKDIKKSWD